MNSFAFTRILSIKAIGAASAFHSTINDQAIKATALDERANLCWHGSGEARILE